MPVLAISLEKPFERFQIVPLTESSRVLEGFSKINILVGENNSGKSRFLRTFLRTGAARLEIDLPLQELDRCRWRLCEHLDGLARSRGVIVDNIAKAAGDIPEIRFLEEGVSFKNAFSGPINALNSVYSNYYQEISRDISDLIKQLMDAFRAVESGPPDSFSFVRVYIPTLRGLRPLGDVDRSGGINDLYRTVSLRDYKEDLEHARIFTGQTLFDEVEKHLLGDHDQRKLVAKYESFLSRNFFDNETITLIPRYGSNGILEIKIGKEKQYPIHHLGDGIQSVIIMTFPLFLYRDQEMLIGIEEPELFLHPGLQRALLKAFLSSEFSLAQFFFTTHSNHFLDLTLDVKNISVFTFRKSLAETDDEEVETNTEIENVNSDDMRSLQLLGVRNSAVFLSNCTIWVEGITDRRFFSKYLSIFIEHQLLAAREGRVLEEDLHYSFVEYAGSNITHYSFLEGYEDSIQVDRICSRLFLIVDRDQGKEERFDKLKEKLGERFLVLDVKEVENLLTDDVLKRVVSAYEGGEPEFVAKIPERTGEENIGEFIERKMLKNKKRRGSYIDGNTVSDKVKFCDRALESTTSMGDLSLGVVEIVKKLYDFVLSNNA